MIQTERILPKLPHFFVEPAIVFALEIYVTFYFILFILTLNPWIFGTKLFLLQSDKCSLPIMIKQLRRMWEGLCDEMIPADKGDYFTLKGIYIWFENNRMRKHKNVFQIVRRQVEFTL